MLYLVLASHLAEQQTIQKIFRENKNKKLDFTWTLKAVDVEAPAKDKSVEFLLSFYNEVPVVVCLYVHAVLPREPLANCD